MIVIGLVGEKGGGKGTLVDILKELKSLPLPLVHLRSSDLLLEIAGLVDMKRENVTREQLIRLAVDLENNFGKGCISRGMRNKIMKHDGIVIFDGIRLPTDPQLIRSFPQNFLVYVTARADIRYERAKKRKEKAGEGSLTYEQFIAEENLPTEKHIPEIGSTADYVIQNDGSPEDYRKKILIFAKYFLNAAE